MSILQELICRGLTLASSNAGATYGNLTNQTDEQIASNAWEGSRIGSNAARENAFFIAKSDQRIVGTDGKNDHQIILLDDQEAKTLLAKYSALKQALPASGLMLDDYAKTDMASKEAEILKVSESYQSQGERYNLTISDDFNNLTAMTKESGMQYSTNLTNMIFNQQPRGKQEMLNIFYQNGMQNTTKLATDIGGLISQKINAPVGLIINNTDPKFKVAGDMTEYLPNGLYLKDALNGEVYQQIVKQNPDSKILVIAHSAGNEDLRKGAEANKLLGVNFKQQIEVISVGSPLSASKLQSSLEPAGIKLIGQYNNWKDPVTNPKSWGVGIAATGIIGGVVAYQAMSSLGILGMSNASGTGLEQFTNLVLTGAATVATIAAGATKHLITIRSPLRNIFQQKFQ